jgi:SAM-dependent methyltransferase
MGIEAFSLRMLCSAKQRGAEFSNTVTLGRQDLSLHEREFDAIVRDAGRSRADLARRGVTGIGVADSMLIELLGITRLVSIDCSSYEGATLIHDMNLPIDAALRETFDAVIDTGTLEHVFNFPVAVANCMNMLRVGGRFYALTPANNHCGHGFYQFSPELFFRIFNSSNGFALEHVIAVEHPYPGIELSRTRTAYSVKDPGHLSQRVNLTNSRPVYLFVQALKCAAVEPFASAPQQSDYAAAWQSGRFGQNADAGNSSNASFAPRAAAQIWKWHAALPLTIRRPLLGLFQRWYGHTFRNRRAYRPWNQRGTPPSVS